MWKALNLALATLETLNLALALQAHFLEWHLTRFGKELFMYGYVGNASLLLHLNITLSVYSNYIWALPWNIKLKNISKGSYLWCSFTDKGNNSMSTIFYLFILRNCILFLGKSAILVFIIADLKSTWHLWCLPAKWNVPSNIHFRILNNQWPYSEHWSIYLTFLHLRIGRWQASHAKVRSSIPGRVKEITYNIEMCHLLPWRLALLG